MNPTPEPAPLVTVIIHVYNGELFLSAAIESVMAQTFLSYELIVVDDGSTDRTREVAVSYPSVKYLHQVNSGTASARNLGIENAIGEYIAFLDADDLWLPDKLALQMASFGADPSLEVVSGFIEQFISPGEEQKYSIPDRPMPGYSTSAILMKRKVIDAIGLFHEHYLTAETISWFARLIDKEQKILMLPNVVARRRIHGSNASIRNQRERDHSIIRVLKESIKRKRANALNKDHS